MKKNVAVTLLVALVLAVALPVLAEGPDGKALYESKCAMCHGKDGVAKSTAKGAGNLNDPAWQKNNPPEVVAKVIAEGKGKMPKYAEKLKPEEIKAVADYVKSMK